MTPKGKGNIALAPGVKEQDNGQGSPKLAERAQQVSTAALILLINQFNCRLPSLYAAAMIVGIVLLVHSCILSM